jgi:hypothetical protein
MCPECKGTGWVDYQKRNPYTGEMENFVRRCDCTEKDLRPDKVFLERINVNKKVKNRVSEPADDKLASYLRFVMSQDRPVKIFNGEYGNGKTTHALRIALYLVRKRATVVWYRAEDFLSLYRNTQSGYSENIEKWEIAFEEAEKSYLFLDDLGIPIVNNKIDNTLVDSECLRMVLEFCPQVYITTNYPLFITRKNKETGEETKPLISFYTGRVNDLFREALDLSQKYQGDSFRGLK